MDNFFIFIFILLVYLLPMIIAIGNKKRNMVAISLMNILLGWSVICWIISLIWAVSKDDQPKPIIIKEKKKEIDYTQLEKLNNLLEKNIISKEEFEFEKRKILNNKL